MAKDSINHLRLESFFSISGLSATKMLSELPYQGPTTLSYHFSFLINSPDKRTLVRSPIKFFSFKEKILMLKKIYKFSLLNSFLKPSVLSFSDLNFSSFLIHYNFSIMVNSLILLFYFSCIFVQLNRPNISFFSIEKNSRLLIFGFSSISFYKKSVSYLLPRVVLFKKLTTFPNFYNKLATLTNRRHTLLDGFKPYINSPIYAKKAIANLFAKKKAQTKYYSFKEFLALNKKSY